MRFLIIILILIFGSCSKKETTETGRLKIIPVYCKYENRHIPKNKFRLFKKEENSIKFKTIKEYEILSNNFIILNLEYGKYYIEYVTIYNQKNTVEFNVNEPELKKIDLCLDYLDYKSNKNVLLIDELKNGENLLLEFFHEGCFSTFDKPVKFNLSKIDNKIVAEYNGKRYSLTKEQIELFREFEIELRSNHTGWCSSQDTYHLFNKKSYQIYEVKDSSGQWRGFDNLLKLLKITTANSG